MRPSAFLALALTLSACKGRATAPIQPDPTVPHPVPTPAPKVDADPRVLFQGRVVDLKARSVVHVLEKDRPRHEAAFGGVAYLATATELRAYDMKTGAKRWSVPAVCDVVEAAAGGAFCGTSAGVVRHDPTTGAATTVSTKSVAQLVALDGRILGVHGDRSLESWDGGTGVVVGTGSVPFTIYGAREGFVANPKGACAASIGKELQLHCVDASAKTLYTNTYPLAKPTDPSSTRFARRQLDDRYMVTSTWFGKSPRRGVVVRVADGVELARLEEEIVAAFDRDGALDGLLVTQPTTQLFEPSGKLRWTSPEKLIDAAAVLPIGDTLVVSSYHPIASGADLRAFDRLTGKLLWNGDVALLPIAHSKYSNHVDLSRAFDHVVMRGTESGQVYLELFDPKDGARRFEVTLGTW